MPVQVTGRSCCCSVTSITRRKYESCSGVNTRFTSPVPLIPSTPGPHSPPLSKTEACTWSRWRNVGLDVAPFGCV